MLRAVHRSFHASRRLMRRRCYTPALSIEPIESRILLSAVIDVQLAGGGKTLDLSQLPESGIVNMEVWARITGSDFDTTNDGVQTIGGSFLSSNIQGGSVAGTLLAATIYPFDGLISSNGSVIDLDGDGDLDVGANDAASGASIFIASADFIQSFGDSVTGTTVNFKIADLAFGATDLLGNGTTEINFRPLAGFWGEDFQFVDDTVRPLSAGPPVVITRNSGPIGDVIAPAALLVSADVTSSESSTYAFFVNYTDDTAVDVNTLDSADIQVTGPNGFSQSAGLLDIDLLSNGTPRLAIYSISAPGGFFDSGDNGVYTISLRSGEVADTAQNFAAGRTLGTFNIRIGGGDVVPPAATAALAGVSAASNSYRFSVTYTDDLAVNVATIDSTDIRITGPRGFSQSGVLDSIDIDSNGSPRVATYHITPPGGSWDPADNGVYSASVVAGQIADTSQNFAAAGALGTFTVNVAYVARPTVSLSPSGNRLQEGAAFSLSITAQLSAPTDRDVEVHLHIDGSATPADYLLSAPTLIIRAGQTSASLTLSAVADAQSENDENIRIGIASADNATVQQQAPIEITIVGETAAPAASIRFSAPSFSVNEADGEQRYQIETSTGLAPADIVVPLFVEGDAKVDDDYSPVPATITIHKDESVASFTVNIRDDALREPTEKIIFRLGTPSNARVETSGATLEVKITDNDSQTPISTAAGLIDLRFGQDGKVSLNFRSNDLAVQPDGRILLGGREGSDVDFNSKFVLARLNADGTIDKTFGKKGRAVFTPPSGFGEILDIELQDDGRILAVGSDKKKANTGETPSSQQFLIVRFLADGKPDTQFGTTGDGSVRLPIGALSTARAVKVRAGKIIVAGESIDGVAVAQLNQDGSRDPSFGLSGVVTKQFDARDVVRDLAVDGSGRILVAGGTVLQEGQPGSFSVVRFAANGNLDGAFGVAGRAVVGFDGDTRANAIQIDKAGGILVGGSGGVAGEFGLIKLTDVGVLDTGFGEGGVVTTTFFDDDGQAGPGFIFDLLIQPDGRIVAAGGNGTDGNIAMIARYEVNGLLDPTFGEGGKESAKARKVDSLQAGFDAFSGTSLMALAGAQGGGLLALGNNPQGGAVLASVISDGIPPAATLDKPRPNNDGRVVFSRAAPFYTISLRLNDASGVAASLLNSKNLIVTGPGGKAVVTLVKVSPSADNRKIVAVYQLRGPGNGWDKGDNGEYKIALKKKSIQDIFGNSATFEARFQVQIK